MWIYLDDKLVLVRKFKITKIDKKDSIKIILRIIVLLF